MSISGFRGLRIKLGIDNSRISTIMDRYKFILENLRITLASFFISFRVSTSNEAPTLAYTLKLGAHSYLDRNVPCQLSISLEACFKTLLFIKCHLQNSLSEQKRQAVVDSEDLLVSDLHLLIHDARDFELLACPFPLFAFLYLLTLLEVLIVDSGIVFFFLLRLWGSVLKLQPRNRVFGLPP